MSELIIADMPDLLAGYRHQRYGIAVQSYKLNLVCSFFRVTVDDSTHITSMKRMLGQISRQDDSFVFSHKKAPYPTG